MAVDDRMTVSDMDEPVTVRGCARKNDASEVCLDRMDGVIGIVATRDSATGRS